MAETTQQVTSKMQNVLFLPQKGLTYMYSPNVHFMFVEWLLCYQLHVLHIIMVYSDTSGFRLTCIHVMQPDMLLFIIDF